MIKALAFCSGIDLDSREVADLACQVGAQWSGALPVNVGLYAAAYGGLNSVEVGSRSAVAEPLSVSPDTWQLLVDSFVMFRPSDAAKHPPSLPHEVAGTWHPASTAGVLKRSSDWAREIRSAFEHGDLVGVGQFLHDSWLDQRQNGEHLADSFLDHCYLVARENGALGGHVDTAMGLPFLGVFCKDDNQPAVEDALAALGMHRWPLRLVAEGVEVLEAMPRSWSKMTTATSLLMSMRP